LLADVIFLSENAEVCNITGREHGPTSQPWSMLCYGSVKLHCIRVFLLTDYFLVCVVLNVNMSTRTLIMFTPGLLYFNFGIVC